MSNINSDVNSYVYTITPQWSVEEGRPRKGSFLFFSNDEGRVPSDSHLQIFVVHPYILVLWKVRSPVEGYVPPDPVRRGSTVTVYVWSQIPPSLHPAPVLQGTLLSPNLNLCHHCHQSLNACLLLPVLTLEVVNSGRYNQVLSVYCWWHGATSDKISHRILSVRTRMWWWGANLFGPKCHVGDLGSLSRSQSIRCDGGIFLG